MATIARSRRGLFATAHGIRGPEEKPRVGKVRPAHLSRFSLRSFRTSRAHVITPMVRPNLTMLRMAASLRLMVDEERPLVPSGNMASFFI